MASGVVMFVIILLLQLPLDAHLHHQYVEMLFAKVLKPVLHVQATVVQIIHHLQIHVLLVIIIAMMKRAVKMPEAIGVKLQVLIMDFAHLHAQHVHQLNFLIVMFHQNALQQEAIGVGLGAVHPHARLVALAKFGIALMKRAVKMQMATGVNILILVHKARAQVLHVLQQLVVQVLLGTALMNQAANQLLETGARALEQVLHHLDGASLHLAQVIHAAKTALGIVMIKLHVQVLV